MLRNCPFCGSSKIKYSVKTKGNYFQAACYCDECHSYGPRILSDKYDKHAFTYSLRHVVQNDLELRAKAEAAWNNRTLAEMHELAEKLRKFYSAPCYQPTEKSPTKHTMITFLLANIDAFESSITNFNEI